LSIKYFHGVQAEGSYKYSLKSTIGRVSIDPGGPPGIIDVFTYSGDGMITADEFFAGTLFTSFSNNGSGTVSVDVTEAVRASESNFLGFRLSTTTSDRYDLGSIAGLPEPTLRITFIIIE
jgi:hypothetical protein